MTDAHHICVIPGDGVGVEVVPQALRVLRAAAAVCGFELEFDLRPWGSAYYREHGLMMPADAASVVGDADATLGAGLQGALGLAASANINPQTGVGVFEPIHGSAPDIAGRGVANPLGTINSAAMLLDHIGRADAAELVRTAVDATLTAGVTPADLGGTRSTLEMGDAVVERIAARAT
jgi:isocitrate/isopropylmalate dehydrogenase